MERHSIDEETAFKLLRDHARRSQLKIVEIAEAVLSSYRLLTSESKDRVEAGESESGDA
jgi:hypothetical protein